MSKMQIEINADNAAFDDEPSYEIARILRDLAKRIETNGCHDATFSLYDVNGNKCGWADFEGFE